MPFYLDTTDNEVASTGAVAAQTDVESTGIDTFGFNGVVFRVLMGAITAGAATVAKLQESDDDGDADAYADVDGASITIADDDDDKLFILEYRMPVARYVRCVVTRATEDSAVTAILAILTDPQSAPVTQGSNVADSVVVTGDRGAARGGV